MRFGQRVRILRVDRGLTQQQLAVRVGVSTSYICKVENHRLRFGDYPSEKFIHKLADVLGADESELLLLAEKVPESIRQRIRQRPEAFAAFAACDDATIDRLLAGIPFEIGATDSKTVQSSETE